jgi:hypothetical protein
MRLLLLLLLLRLLLTIEGQRTSALRLVPSNAALAAVEALKGLTRHKSLAAEVTFAFCH